MAGLLAFLGKGTGKGSATAYALALAVLLALLALLVLSATGAAADSPPVAIITSPEDGSTYMVGETVTFDGSQSMDEDVANLTYHWDISGQLISGKDKAVVQRAFTTIGDVQVILRVEDVGGLESTTFVSIHIRAFNQAPVAVISAPSDGQVVLNGRSISFDGSSSYDPDGGSLVYRWETNRTIDPIGTTAAFTIRLPLGRYRVTLFVFDQAGDPGTATVNITVEINVPPQLSSGGVNPMVGPRDLEGGFNFSVTYRDDDNDPPTSIQVKVGPPGALVGHPMVPSDPGDDNYRDGARFHVAVELPPGEHRFVFSCKDLFYSCATVLYQGPQVYLVQTIPSPNLGATVTINWTEVGVVTMQAVASPGPVPPETVMISNPVRTIVNPGVWSDARIRLEYGTGQIVEDETITLLWYDPARFLWVPASAQRHDPGANTVEGDLPSGDVVMAVIGRLSDENVNNPPNLVISYDIGDAYVGELLMFDASCSTDPDGGELLFHWDLNDDGEPGPWIPGTVVSRVYEEKGVHQVVLRATDGSDLYYKYENVTIRAEREYIPGPWDNPGALFLLASLMVIAFGMAVAYRLHRPRTYDDIYGKAYRQREEDEYSQLFRKLTEAELRGAYSEEEMESEGDEDEGDEDVGDEDEGDEDEGDEDEDEEGPSPDGEAEEDGEEPPPEGDEEDEEEAPD
jgi:hypothetical protein